MGNAWIVAIIVVGFKIEKATNMRDQEGIDEGDEN